MNNHAIAYVDSPESLYRNSKRNEISGSWSNVPIKAKAFTEVHTDTSESKVIAEEPFKSLAVDRKDLDVIAIIREYALCEDGWKGEGSVAASREVIKDAEVFASTILYDNHDIEKPDIGLDADGDITFYWKTDQVIIDLSIYGDGTYSFYAEAISGECYRSDETSIEETLPDEVIQLLRN